jgi:hypothetical protein
MSNFIHYDLSAGPDNVIEVEVDKRANVLLMDRLNFSSYRQRRAYRYFGGQALRSPVRLVPPHSGDWVVVIDLGGASGRLNTACRVI